MTATEPSSKPKILSSTIIAKYQLATIMIKKRSSSQFCGNLPLKRQISNKRKAKR